MIITEKSWYSNVSEDMEYKYHKKLFNSFFIQFIFYFLICECIYVLKESSVFLSQKIELKGHDDVTFPVSNSGILIKKKFFS